jgi:hypothetical protein
LFIFVDSEVSKLHTELNYDPLEYYYAYNKYNNYYDNVVTIIIIIDLECQTLLPEEEEGSCAQQWYRWHTLNILRDAIYTEPY